jgi:hypothetical protein
VLVSHLEPPSKRRKVSDAEPAKISNLPGMSPHLAGLIDKLMTSSKKSMLTDSMRQKVLGLMEELVNLERATADFGGIIVEQLDRLKVATHASKTHTQNAMAKISDALSTMERADAGRAETLHKLSTALQRGASKHMGVVLDSPLVVSESGFLEAHSDTTVLPEWQMLFLSHIPASMTAIDTRTALSSVGPLEDFLFLPKWRMALATMADLGTAKDVIKFFTEQGSFRVTFASAKINADAVEKLQEVAEPAGVAL